MDICANSILLFVSNSRASSSDTFSKLFFEFIYKSYLLLIKTYTASFTSQNSFVLLNNTFALSNDTLSEES